ncbi:uncharacterized protein LOC105161804 [Sesamum indicum]|uniref:Uncharacterized protein LOC105161804 n=1 Tax=Sesamum indicum TaxID=4182 RepID=A0A6I9TB98_SESIN|nr:uncharacterized protein LOC105161804 [Sesamum indicum]
MLQCSSCRTTTFFPLSPPQQPPPHKFYPLPKQLLCSYRCSSSSLLITQPQLSSLSPRVSPLKPRSVSSPQTPVVEDDAEEESGSPPSADEMFVDSGSLPPLTGCKACGREEIEKGCNGEGRIQGGIATVPGFGWWPIKAYRPCPAYVASGGRYRRSGQSMDEVVSGGGGRDASARKSDGTPSSKKKEGPRRFKG